MTCLIETAPFNNIRMNRRFDGACHKDIVHGNIACSCR